MSIMQWSSTAIMKCQHFVYETLQVIAVIAEAVHMTHLQWTQTPTHKAQSSTPNICSCSCNSEEEEEEKGSSCQYNFQPMYVCMNSYVYIASPPLSGVCIVAHQNPGSTGPFNHAFKCMLVQLFFNFFAKFYILYLQGKV